MQKLTPKLSRYVAEQKLAEYFSSTTEKAKEMSSMTLFAEELSHQDKYAKHYVFRLMKCNIDHILVSAVLQSLPPDYQKYIRLKYKGNKKVIGLSVALFTSPSQLNVWHDKIILQIQNTLSYRLTSDDIYDYKKIINMLEALAKILSTVEEIDPEHEVVDDYWLNAIGYYYNNYHSLLEALQNCMLYENHSNINRAVVLMKDHPFSSKDELAKIFGCTSGTFGRYLMEYSDMVQDYIYHPQG